VPVSKVTRARSDSIAGPTLSSWSMSPIALIDRNRADGGRGPMGADGPADQVERG
jgi:hypothetical protein